MTTLTHASLAVAPPRPTDDKRADEGDQAATRSPVRPLSHGEVTMVAVVAALVAVLGLLGFVNSFVAVMDAAAGAFGRLAFTVPIGIDVGIAAFSALDIVLARLDMRIRGLRLIPWSLTAATVYLNVAGEPTAFGKVAHAVLPCLWVVAVEIGAHVVRVRAGLVEGTQMDGVRLARWLLAPVPTARLRRRMVLWEIRSYPEALRRERDRLLGLTELQDTYGRFGWRWKAPRRVRALYRLGELTPAQQMPELLSRIEETTSSGRKETARRTTSTAKRGRSRTRSRTKQRTVPDVDDLMTLGWRIVADLDARGEPLTRDSLAAALREEGQAVRNERVGALLERLKSEVPSGPVVQPSALAEEVQPR